MRSLLSEGRYFRGDRYFRDLLTPVTLYRFFRTFATCEGSLHSLLYGSYGSYTTDLNISHSISNGFKSQMSVYNSTYRQIERKSGGALERL